MIDLFLGIIIGACGIYLYDKYVKKRIPVDKKFIDEYNRMKRELQKHNTRKEPTK